MKNKIIFLFLILATVGWMSPAAAAQKGHQQGYRMPKLRERAILTYAPEVPPPMKRSQPAIVEVDFESSVKKVEIKPGVTYEYWTFNGQVPGPFIRVRVGDMLEVHHTNSDERGMPHNIDFHAVTGPGGGAPVTTVVQGEKRTSWFRMLHPGLFIYHCAAPPVMDHIANGMYGLILVEPKGGLSKVDREFYVMQHEVYGRFEEKKEEKRSDNEGTGKKDIWEEETKDAKEESGLLQFSHEDGLAEHPRYIFFNGRYNRHVGAGALKAKTGERVRIFFGNIGPNLISSFHVIGEIFDHVYREGDLVSPPAHSVQTTLVPAGGATVVEFGLEVPGTFTLVDHAIFRIEKGAVGFLEVEGPARHDIYVSDQDAAQCEGCMVHP